MVRKKNISKTAQDFPVEWCGAGYKTCESVVARIQNAEQFNRIIRFEKSYSSKPEERTTLNFLYAYSKNYQGMNYF